MPSTPQATGLLWPHHFYKVIEFSLSTIELKIYCHEWSIKIDSSHTSS